MSEHGQTQDPSQLNRHHCNTQEGQEVQGVLKSLPSSEGSSTRKAGPIRFLVADDNKVMRKIFAKKMGQLGHGCDLVVNGEEAVEAYKSNHAAYHCVLMDVSMPVMGGIEATRLIRAFESENDLRPGNVVAVTAQIRELFARERDRLRELGFTTALQKLFRTEDLDNLIDELGLAREVSAEDVPCQPEGTIPVPTLNSP